MECNGMVSPQRVNIVRAPRVGGNKRLEMVDPKNGRWNLVGKRTNKAAYKHTHYISN